MAPPLVKESVPWCCLLNIEKYNDMRYLSLDYLVVYSFLLITLVIGLWTGRGIKNVREYATANKMFGTGTLVLTWLATDIAGETILDMTNSVRMVGIIQPLTVFGGCGIAMLMQALVFAPQFVRFSRCMTMGDVMGQLYKKPAQVMTGILGFFTALCIAGMELTVLGLLCEHLLGIDFRFGVGVGGLLLVVYTAHGGIKSVAFTDLFQGLILFIVVPIIMVAVLKQAGGVKHVLMQAPPSQLQFFNHPKSSYYLALFLSLSVFQFSVIDPALMQRILMGRTRQQLRHQFFIVATCLFALMLALSLLGLASIILYPANTDVSIVMRVVGTILPAGIKGLAIAGLLAVTMATFDSFLHAAGLTLIHDVINIWSSYMGRPLDELKWTRYATMLIGFLVIGVGFGRADELYNFVLLSYKFTGPLLAFPLFAGVCGLKPDQHAFYVASGATIVMLLLAQWLCPASQDHWVPLVSVAVNGFFFLGTHAIRNRGLAVINTKQKQSYLWKPRPESLWVRLKCLLPTPTRIVAYSQRQVERYGSSHMLFAVFCCVNYLFPYFMWDHDTPKAYDLMLYLRLIGAMMCGLILVKDKWPEFLLPYLPTYWHLTLLYCLPFTSTIMFLLTQGSIEWLINVALIIIFFIVLVDWLSFVLLTTLGISLGLLYYTLAIGPIQLQLDFSTGYLLVYQGIFATLVGLLFARRKQKSFEILSMQREQLLQDNQASKKELLSAAKTQIRFTSVLKKAGIEKLESLAHLSKQLLAFSKQGGPIKEVTALAQQLTDQLTPMALNMDKFVHRTMGVLLLENVKKLLLDEFLQEMRRKLQNKGYSAKISVLTLEKEIQCDVEKMQQVILNSFSFIRSMSVNETEEKESVLLGIEETQLGYPLKTVEDEHTKQITALRFTITSSAILPALDAVYMSQVNEEILLSPTSDLPLLANERIVKAHYGYTKTINEGEEITMVYVIPVNVREVRSKDMDTPQMLGGTEWPRADDTYPGAQEQEQAFLTAVKDKSKADLTRVGQAIDLLKDYHGPVLRKSGEPFYLHPLAVAQIVLGYNQDEATILGALLHDAVEDTPLTLEQVALLFNEEVRTIVNGVTHMESNKATIYKVLLSHPENIRKLLDIEDNRVLYIKLADRIHNMRTIHAKGIGSQRRTAEETLLFFVPLAKYLRLNEAAKELKTRSFDVLGRSM